MRRFLRSRGRLRIALAAVWLLALLLPARPARAATIVVTSTADDGTGSCPSPTNCQLRQALAVAQNGDTI